MEFIILAYDYLDENAYDRRMKVREDHLKMTKENKEKGHVLHACALLSDKGRMVGSCLVVDYPSRQDIQDWLEVEPYVTGRVWEKITIERCAVPELFK